MPPWTTPGIFLAVLAEWIPRSTFHGGTVRTAVDRNDDPTAVTLQHDGKILVGGSTGDTSVTPFWNWRWFVERFTTTGSVDPTFAQNGIRTTEPTGGPQPGSYLNALVVDSAERIYAAGTPQVDGSAVVRYDRNGNLDPSWGGTGVVRRPVGQFDGGAVAAALGADGNVVTVSSGGSNG